MVAKGRIDGKVIVLDEPLDLPVDSRVLVQVEPEAPADTQDLLAWIEAHAVRDASIPNDLSREHDHYLYGAPKAQQE